MTERTRQAFPHGQIAPLLVSVGLVVGTALPFSPQPAAAIQYSDGRVGFSYPLRLTDSYATRTTISESGVTYYLIFDFPVEAQEPLDRVMISLDEGRDNIFRYNLEATEAFLNTPDGRVPIPLGEVSQTSDQHKVLTIPFDPPVTPGQSITLALRPVQNPRFGGVYLFGATAFPVGENVRPTFMGYARLSFYESDGGFWP